MADAKRDEVMASHISEVVRATGAHKAALERLCVAQLDAEKASVALREAWRRLEIGVDDSG